jgi:hypothetical protein
MTNPTQLIRDLDADAIRTRLGEIEQERRALLVLLRAARRAQPKQLNAIETTERRDQNPAAAEQEK